VLVTGFSSFFASISDFLMTSTRSSEQIPSNKTIDMILTTMSLLTERQEKRQEEEGGGKEKARTPDREVILK
jgi:hypothetical protein